MRYRSDLEQLITLDAPTIEWACGHPDQVADLITFCVDESLELDHLADETATDETLAGDTLAGDIPSDEQHLYRQEAAAWRATASVLRRLRADCGGRAAGAGGPARTASARSASTRSASARSGAA